ncbi:MAG: hypothetical protein RR835_10605 [Peptostreptococcaceae bacterium]
MNINNNLLARLDFIEFKQQILLLKQPNHKVSVFANLSLSEYLNIKNYVNRFERSMNINKDYTFNEYENGLYELCPLIKTYPGSSILIAKILMDIKNFDLLFSHYN